MTVPLEVGHDEIGDTADAVLRLAPDLLALFETLGLAPPGPVRVLAVHHQIAQKLHACTVAGSDRAHDLVDLQLLESSEPGPLDFPLTRTTAKRLFASRQAHAWPPTIASHPTWEPLYRDAAEGLSVHQDLGEACAWGNNLIRRIDNATS